MLEMLDLKPTDKLMEIGTGSGTQTAEFAKYCAEVHSIELKPVRVASYLGEHVYLRHGDGAKGIPSEAPFDAIVATCGVRDIPTAWVDQMRDQGRLVVPVGDRECQKLTKYVKRNGLLEPERIGAYVRFMVME